MVRSTISYNIFLKKIVVVLSVSSILISETQEFSLDYPELIDPEPDCQYNTEYDLTTKSCSDPKCPNDSVGIFPNCTCAASNFDYSISLNICFRVCPYNSTGYWPNCECTGESGFDKDNFECRECPPNTVSGIFPNCVCEDENSRFNAHLNYCESCPSESSGKIPNCLCDDGSGEIKC